MKKLLVSSGMILLSMLCFASPLTVEDAIAKAKSYDADYALAMRQYSNAVSITNKESVFTPSLSLSGSLSTGASFFSQDGFSADWNGVTGSVGISSTFSFSGSSLNEKKSKQISNESLLLSFQSSEIELESSVISGYFSIAMTRDSIALSKANLEHVKSQYENVKESYDAGLSSELELVQAENSVSEMEYTISSLESAYSLYLLSFKNLTGLDASDMELIDVSSYEAEDILSSYELFDRFAYSSPTIKAKDLAARSAELAYDTTKKTYTIPSLTASADYAITGYDTSGISGIGDNLSLAVKVSVPLSSYISTSSANSTVEKAKNSAEDARMDLSNSLTSFKYTLENTCQSISLSKVQIENQERTIEALEKEYSLTEDAYYSGTATLSTLKSVENNLLSARYSLLSLKYQYIQTLYSLAQNLGVSYNDLLEG